jgi:hypothetical protein
VEVEKSVSLFQVAYMEPYADPYSVDEIFLVKRAQPTLMELTGLEDSEPISVPLPVDKDAARRTDLRPAAFAMPDPRSIQERYAP